MAGGTVGGGALATGGGGAVAGAVGTGAAGAAGGTAAATGATGHFENSIMKFCSFKIKDITNRESISASENASNS